MNNSTRVFCTVETDSTKYAEVGFDNELFIFGGAYIYKLAEMAGRPVSTDRLDNFWQKTSLITT